MNPLLKRLRKMADDELLAISEAIDHELERRLELTESVSESARRRAVQRSQSYRRRTGSSGLPVRLAGLRDGQKPNRAA